MKIVYITHHRKYRTEFRSGAFARYLAKQGHEVSLVCIRDRGRFALKETFEDGVRFIQTPDLLWGKMRSGWDPWNTLRRFPLLVKLFDNADLIHAFETRPATIHPIQWALRNKRIPLCIDWIDWWGRGGLIAELRPQWYQIFFERFETYYEEHFRNMADSLTVICSGLKERAMALGVSEEKIYKITGGVDTSFFKPEDIRTYREKFALPQNNKILAFSAQDVTMDIDLVFQSLQKVKEKLPEVLLIVTGRKPRNFEALVQSYKLQNHVIHLGFLPYEELPQVLSCAEVFLLPFPDKPANQGRWPHKIGDYMSLARPTITNPVGEMKLLYEKENIGFAVEANAQAMSAAIVQLFQNVALCETMGRNAREVAKKDFSWEHIVRRLTLCYQETITRFNAS